MAVFYILLSDPVKCQTQGMPGLQRVFYLRWIDMEVCRRVHTGKGARNQMSVKKFLSGILALSLAFLTGTSPAPV